MSRPLPLVGWVVRHGFAADVVQPGEPGADFGRWPDPVPPRDLPDLYRVFLVTGRRC